jgi:predicted secreted protein
MILKGNNFRILTLVGSKYKCIGMASGCTVTLTSNTEESSTKDDVGLASKPTVVSGSWNVSVESLDVTDAAAMLTAMKSLTPFTLMWDETSTTDNQTGEQAAFARTGQAYLNDATFAFNDRENSTKSLQFTGSGELSKITTTPTYEPVDAAVYTKGQFVRLFLSSDNTTTPAAVIAAARQLSFHVSLTLENATTKDTPGDWQIQEPTGLSYDISSTALMRGNDTITSAVAGKSLEDLEDIYEARTPVKFQIANVSGDNQRTKGAVIVSGSVIIATLTMNGPNRQNADYTTALNGYGAYTVGA